MANRLCWHYLLLPFQVADEGLLQAYADVFKAFMKPEELTAPKADEEETEVCGCGCLHIFSSGVHVARSIRHV